MPWYSGLRDSQEAAAGVDPGSYVLLAGPGTGKTFVLVRRIEYLVEELGLPPNELTALTFTRAAAGEMRERLQDTLGDGIRVRVSTLHSYALREILQQETGGIPRPVRVVDDWEERWVVEEEIARALGRSVYEIRALISRLADDWDSLAVDGEGWEEGFPDPEFLTTWRRHRQIYGYTLRAELVYQLLQNMRANPGFEPSGTTQVFLVDEYQDLNRCDLQTIQLLVERAGANIYAAGDDDQSIYSFRHAHPQGIRDFGDHFPGSTRLLMTECLRCGPPVVHLSNWLIAQEVGRIPKDLESVTDWNAEIHLLRFHDINEEAGEVARIAAQELEGGRPPEELLFLLRFDRNNQASNVLAEALGAHGIEVYRPRFGTGLDPDVQLLAEYLRLAQAISSGRSDDLAMRALLELENNAIGPTRVGALLRVAWERDLTFTQAVEWLRDDPDEFPSTSPQQVFDAVDAINNRATTLRQQPGESFDDWLDRVYMALDLPEHLQETVLVAAKQVEAVLADVPDDSASAQLDFVQELGAALSTLEDSRPPTVPGSVTVTTMHGGKGLSADVVFVLQAEDEIIPDNLPAVEFDEARRLLYVSLTRARERLFITTCVERNQLDFLGDQTVPISRHLTRFLADYGLTAIWGTDYEGD